MSASKSSGVKTVDSAVARFRFDTVDWQNSKSGVDDLDEMVLSKLDLVLLDNTEQRA